MFNIYFHDMCFDGLASAAYLATYIQAIQPETDVAFKGFTYSGQEITPALIDGDENAIVDYRYVSAENLTWYFDHHVSAFETQADKAHFEKRRDSKDSKFFHTNAAPSCAGYIHGILKEKFNYEAKHLLELIRWAEIIDSANFESPSQVIELVGDGLELMAIISSLKSEQERVILLKTMMHTSVAEIVKAPQYQKALGDYRDNIALNIKRYREKINFQNNVALVDLSTWETPHANKFIPYYLNTLTEYAIVLSVKKQMVHLSVGFNPWFEKSKNRHIISDICESFGGGGHPYVGGITRPYAELSQAQDIANTIFEILQK